jgi:hypothetical protein
MISGHEVFEFKGFGSKNALAGSRTRSEVFGEKGDDNKYGWGWRVKGRGSNLPQLTGNRSKP